MLYHNTWHIITYVKAEPYLIRKRGYPNGDIIEIKIWRIEKGKDKPHGFKYSLVFIRGGKRIIGYDNAEGKEDHRHYEGKEYAYEFDDIDKLIDDFFNDVRGYRDES